MEDDGVIPQAFTDEAANALSKVLGLQWFSRVWTVQEAVLPGKATVVIGSVRLQWATFMEAAREAQIWKLTKFQPSKDMMQALDELEDKVLPLKNDHGSFQISYGSMHYRLLERYQHRQATETPDKVFGLLAMTHGLTVGALIKPDYTKDVSVIYTSICRRIIESSKSLEALSQRYVHDRKDLPS